MKKHRGFNPYSQSKEKREERNKYPKFIFTNEGSDPEFSQIIKEIVQAFDFNEIPDELKPIYRDIKKLGYWKAIEPVKKEFYLGESMGTYVVLGFLCEAFLSPNMATHNFSSDVIFFKRCDAL